MADVFLTRVCWRKIIFRTDGNVADAEHSETRPRQRECMETGTWRVCGNKCSRNRMIAQFRPTFLTHPFFVHRQYNMHPAAWTIPPLHTSGKWQSPLNGLGWRGSRPGGVQSVIVSNGNTWKYPYTSHSFQRPDSFAAPSLAERLSSSAAGCWYTRK